MSTHLIDIRTGRGSASQPDSSTHARVALLDGFELTLAGRAWSFPPGIQRLVAFLALSERPCLRMHAAGMLWPDASEGHAYSSLRSTLWRLQRTAGRLVKATSTHLVLAPDVAVDVREAVQLARFALDPTAEIADVDSALLLLSTDLLPGWYDDWVLIKREWFRQLRLHALERLSERLIDAGSFDQAVEAAVLAVAGEPLRETARRALIHAHVAEGNTGEAVREYIAYRDLLRSELGVSPSPLMQNLVRGLRV